jgi:hypothetical protein
MNSQKGYLLSTREEWSNMEEVPSEKYINVGHSVKNDHHIWKVKVRYLINQSRWCPECNGYFCQKVLQMYMNKILGVDFRPITLKKAFGLKSRDGGLLKYDAFSENVKIEGLSFKVAAEYDGEQHDIYPNSYHDSIEKHFDQKRRDSLKDDISSQNQIVLIRSIAVKEFLRKTINCFQEEIIKQLNSHSIIKKFNAKIKNFPIYVYNPVKKRLEVKKESLNGYLQ